MNDYKHFGLENMATVAQKFGDANKRAQLLTIIPFYNCAVNTLPDAHADAPANTSADYYETSLQSLFSIFLRNSQFISIVTFTTSHENYSNNYMNTNKIQKQNRL